MSFTYSNIYLNDLKDILDHEKRFLFRKTIALTGATGLIGSYLIDALLIDRSLEVTILAMVRDISQAQARFSYFNGDLRLKFIEIDLNQPLHVTESIDYLIHAASATSPDQYQAHPIDTMLLNMIGTKQVLDLAAAKKSRFIFLSSTEVYGQSDGRLLDEKYSGYLDSLDPRSAYNEGKRAGETLSIAYRHEKGLDVVIPRLSRVFGPTQKPGDRKALSQFIQAGLRHEPIVLKSAGTQKFSYTYVSDIVSGILFLLANGRSGEAYNIASEEQKELREIASMIGEIRHCQVTFDQKTDPNLSYSKAEHALLDITKIKALGWQPRVTLREGLAKTFAANE
ncbi:MAG: NAD-dependent epimerase/dehydratase family protein [Bacilli bacterium]|jgi:nucleoside-diphosphate-sugar epimerase